MIVTVQIYLYTIYIYNMHVFSYSISLVLLGQIAEIIISRFAHQNNVVYQVDFGSYIFVYESFISLIKVLIVALKSIALFTETVWLILV